MLNKLIAASKAIELLEMEIKDFYRGRSKMGSLERELLDHATGFTKDQMRECLKTLDHFDSTMEYSMKVKRTKAC